MWNKIYIITWNTPGGTQINPLPANHDYICFKFVLLADKLTVIGDEMTVFKRQDF